jgi:hypothetical protein
MALNEQAKYAYDGINTAIEDATGWFSQFLKKNPSNVEEYSQQTGVGVIQFPKGSNMESTGRAPMGYKPGAGRKLDAQNTAIKYDNATKRLVIPRDQNYAGIAPSAVGISPSGQIILTSLQDERVRFGTTNNNSGWASAVADLKGLDSSDFTSREIKKEAPTPLPTATPTPK